MPAPLGCREDGARSKYSVVLGGAVGSAEPAAGVSDACGKVLGGWGGVLLRLGEEWGTLYRGDGREPTIDHY